MGQKLLTKEQKRVRNNARARLRYEIKMGRVTPPDECDNCGGIPKPAKDGRRLIQAHHHFGYDKPLEIIWLCPGCHMAMDLDSKAYGTANGGSLHSDSFVQEIIDLRNQGHTLRYIAAVKGVSEATVWRYANGQSRKYLTC